MLPEDERLRAHRAVMAMEASQEQYRQRKVLVEPRFALVKGVLGGARFLLRGLTNVTDEWHLLATAGNLRILWRYWVDPPLVTRASRPALAA